MGIARRLRFQDAITWRGGSAGDICDEKGGIVQGAHAEVGGLLLIPDADEKVPGPRSLKCSRIDEDKSVVFIDHLDHSDEAGNFGLGSSRPAGEFWQRSEPGKGSDEEGALWFCLRRLGLGRCDFLAADRLRRFGGTAERRQGDQNQAKTAAFMFSEAVSSRLQEGVEC
jgi:hypothetical protein